MTTPASKRSNPTPVKATAARTSKKTSTTPNDGDAAAPAAESGGDDSIYLLRLYVAGNAPKSLAALANLKRHCEECLSGKYRIEVIDLIAHPHLAAGDQIFALPTLVRKLPPPLKRIIGNLSDKERFLVGLDLKPDA